MRPQNLAKIVRERMEAKGWTKYRLAQEAKVPRQTVGNFLESNKSVTSDTLAKMFAVLDLIVTPAPEKE